MNRRTLIIVTAVVAVGLFAIGGLLYSPTSKEVAVTKPVSNEAPLVRPHSPVFGAKDAPVTIVEFFDPACEACRAFHPVVKKILSEFQGKVRVVAIRVLEAARMQGVFEPVLEALLEFQPRWASHGAPAPGLILAIAEQAGLNADNAQTQMMAPQTVGVLNQDRADVEAVGVRQTPTFFVNGKPLDPFGADELRALVAAEVSANGS